MSSPLPDGMMRTRGGVRIAARPQGTQNVAAVIMGIEIPLTIDESRELRELRDLLQAAELRAARGDVMT